MIPKTREEFKEFCLRKLGKPVIRINVSDSQVDDRIDEAFQVYSERHFDAYMEVWVMYEVTQEDVDRGFIKVPDNILAVQQLMDMPPISNQGGVDYNLTPEFAMISTMYKPWMGSNLLDFYIMNLGISETRDLLQVTPRFEHSRHTGELIVYDGKPLKVGNRYFIFVSKILTPDENPGVWNDRWFKQYCSELIRKQWGVNMMKHGEIQLLGGVQVNGQAMIDMADRELELLRTQLIEEFTEPVGFFMG